MNPKSNKNASLVALTASLAAAVIAVAATPVLAAPEGSLAADVLVPVLGEAQKAEDLPSAKAAGSDAVSVFPADSLRALARVENFSYFTALGPDRSDICLVVVKDGPYESVASVCTSRPNFKEHGLSVRVLGDETKGEIPVSAYLLPADVDVESSSGLSPLTKEAPEHQGANLIAGEAARALPSKVELPRESTGRPFILEKIG